MAVIFRYWYISIILFSTKQENSVELHFICPTGFQTSFNDYKLSAYATFLLKVINHQKKRF